MNFEHLTKVNVARCQRWHAKGLEDWSPERWYLATLGELGEAANALKKLWRIQSDMQNISEPERQLSTREQAIKAIGDELSDTIIYLNLFATRIDEVLFDKNFTMNEGYSAEDYLIDAASSLAECMNNFIAEQNLERSLQDTLASLQRFAKFLNIDLDAAIVAKFNATSEKYGFPERL